MKSLKAHSIPRSTLPYQAPFQPYGSWFALVTVAIITFFKGFDTFTPFNTANFITAYIALPGITSHYSCHHDKLTKGIRTVFFFLWAGYKIYFRTRVIPVNEVDLVSGKREIDEEEQAYLDLAEKMLKAGEKKSVWSRMWDWV